MIAAAADFAMASVESFERFGDDQGAEQTILSAVTVLETAAFRLETTLELSAPERRSSVDREDSIGDDLRALAAEILAGNDAFDAVVETYDPEPVATAGVDEIGSDGHAGVIPSRLRSR